jgi:threonine synthase
MSMLFHSTRGLSPEVDLKTVALNGLAPDGGLYLPVEWPQFSSDDIASMRGKSYQDIALQVLRPFMVPVIPENVLIEIIEKSYAVFDSAEVTPLRKLNDDICILELFYGPTLAFKDIALQVLGHIFEYFLHHSDKRMTVIGATSGDTGSAAIAALAERKNIDVIILYPNKGPSDIQRKQMTCVDASNIYTLAIEGSFDDCQKIIKQIFAANETSRNFNITTVNSINMVRILVQMVYYFYAASKMDEALAFVVPTGNFGDIYAGYAAMKCALPISKLIIASNSNDSLTRFFSTGCMQPETMKHTLSPSMDIQISSNFERLLYDICGQNAMLLRSLMDELKQRNVFQVTPQQLEKAKTYFWAGKADDAQTLSTMSEIYKEYAYSLDPHTAVGIKVANDFKSKLNLPIIALATAHPAKFPETVREATSLAPSLPDKIASLMEKPERFILMEANAEKIADYLSSMQN